MTHTEREPEILSDFWRENARQLIDARHVDFTDTYEAARWVGRASAVLAEALRASGDDYGVLAILGAFHDTKARTEVRAEAGPA